MKNPGKAPVQMFLLVCVLFCLPTSAPAQDHGAHSEDHSESCGTDLKSCVLQKYSEYQGRGALGMRIHSLDAQAPPELQGYRLVHGVVSGGAAEKAGLKDGDVIKLWNGEDLRGWDSHHFYRAVEGVRLGDPLQLEVVRGEEVLSFEIYGSPPTPMYLNAWLYAYVMLHFPEDDLKRFENEVDAWLAPVKSSDPAK